MQIEVSEVIKDMNFALRTILYGKKFPTSMKLLDNLIAGTILVLMQAIRKEYTNQKDYLA